MRKYLQPYIDKFTSWNRNRKYKENVYFEIEPNVTHTGLLPIKLLKGQFSGTIYSYGTIKVGDPMEPEYMGQMATFDVEVVIGNQNITADPKFQQISGDILLVILETAIKKEGGLNLEQKRLTDEEDLNDYVEEPTPKRTVTKTTKPKKKRATRKPK